MNNEEKFKQTYDEIHAPEGLLGKVMDLHMEKKEFKTRNLVRAAVCAVAVTIGMFAAGNGICYAATGETLVTKIKVVIDGEVSQQDVEWTQNDDGYHGEVVIPSEDGSSVTIFTVSDNLPADMDVSMYIYKEETEGEDGVVEEEVVEVEINDQENVQSFIYDSFTAGAEVSSNSDEDMDEIE